MYDLTLIIPTLNEDTSIAKTIMKVHGVLSKNNINGQIIIVDDNSTDGTIRTVNEMRSGHPNLSLIIRTSDHGLSQSLVDGFNHAKSDVLMVIDADGQHPVEKITELYQGILDGNDIVLGSRYMGIEGSGVKDWAYHRRVLSWGATMLARILFPAITDSGSGFFAFRKEVIKDAPLKPQGFRMLFEILGKGHWKTVKEIPYIFGVREKGVSKLTAKTVIDFLKQLWGLFTFSLTHPDTHGYKELKRLATFMAVGISGVLVNLGMLYVVTEWVGLSYLWSGLIGVEVSILSNFTLNDLITFRDITHKNFTVTERLITYHLITIMGSAISFSILVTLTSLFGVWYILSGFIGLMVAFIWNFALNRETTWGGD